MDFCFRKYSYPFVVVLLVFLFSCHSLPPSEPLVEEKEFDPRELSWQQVSMPTGLLGDWYSEGKIQLTVGEDTLRVRGVWSLMQSIERSDSYYRIIHYPTKTLYMTTYFLNLTKDEVQVAYTYGTAADEEGAKNLPFKKPWYNMTSTNPWIATSMPGEMSGNWHIHDGKMEMEIDRERVVLDQEVWEIDSVQTNRIVGRLILRSGVNYKSLYFREAGTDTMEAWLIDGKADIQDRYGKVHGDWLTLYKWWDFLEKINFSAGSRWVYDYSYQHYYDQVYDTSTPIDSIVQTESLKGQLEFEVTTSTIYKGTGSLTLQATFQIYEEKGRYYKAQKNGGTQVLTDSSWAGPGGVITEQYEIVLENDTLWYRTEEGNIFFASMKLSSGALVNIRAFVYPFEFPREGFSEAIDIIGEIVFPNEEEPLPKSYKNSQTMSLHISGKYIFLFGQMMNNYAYFSLGTCFQYVNYRFDDNDQRIRYGYGQYYNPYIKETSFSCKLISFTPGY